MSTSYGAPIAIKNEFVLTQGPLPNTQTTKNEKEAQIKQEAITKLHTM